jgi:UTP--glucose-1-phosphate uridylyltransferase
VLPDVLLDESRNRPKVTGLALLKRRAELSGNSQLMVHHVPASEVNKYGIVDLGPEPFAQRQIERLRAVVEKPAPDEAPSCFAVTGRYIFTPGIWPLLEAVTADKKGEIQLTNAIQQLLTKETVECLCKQGNLYDCGDKLGYMKATLAMALQHPDIGESFRAYAEETLNLKSLNLPVLKSGDSSSDTAMPGRENISGRGDVTVMLRSAI